MSNYILVLPDELYHHGIKGQKWGVRRFQNPDGSLTSAGKKRYGTRELGNMRLTSNHLKKFDRRLGKYSEIHRLEKSEQNTKGANKAGVKEAKYATKVLNEQDQRIAELNNRIDQQTQRSRNLSKKLTGLKYEKQNDRVKTKIDKLKALKKKIDDSNYADKESVAELTNTAKDMVKHYSSKEFSLDTFKTARFVDRGRQNAAAILGGIPGMLIYEGVTNASGGNSLVISTGYKVKYNRS